MKKALRIDRHAYHRYYYIILCCSVAQWQSRWLLTTWSLVRIQPEQPGGKTELGSGRLGSKALTRVSNDPANDLADLLMKRSSED